MRSRDDQRGVWWPALTAISSGELVRSWATSCGAAAPDEGADATPEFSTAAVQLRICSDVTLAASTSGRLRHSCPHCRHWKREGVWGAARGALWREAAAAPACGKGGGLARRGRSTTPCDRTVGRRSVVAQPQQSVESFRCTWRWSGATLGGGGAEDNTQSVLRCGGGGDWVATGWGTTQQLPAGR